MRIDDALRESASALKFEALADELRRRVVAGTWPVGSKLPTERELMRSTGLSLTTVRRAYDTLVEDQLIVRRRGAGTFVAARPEVEQTALRIGVMLPEAHSYFGRAVRGIEETLTENGASLALVITEYRAHREDDALASLLRDGVDGLIAVPVLTQDAGRDALRLERVLEQPVPLVLMERRLPGPVALDDTEHVVSDHAGGAADAVRHLADLGHRRIALVHRQRAYTSLGVLDGYRAACGHLDIEPDVIGVDAPTWGAGAADLLLVDLRDRGVTAALVLGDPEATLIEARAALAGIRIPDDLALVSYDDEVADLAPVPLTAMAPAKFRMGRLAAELILGRITQRSARPIHQMRLRPRLVVRESCGARRR
ncbi:GntR family transcriptional regulator [Propioniciclava coleopterorum]|uniref:GntR family transcriptional regulator n=1 Tax=Propioniciclava coleopterorum TaxID=2714937 RepID=UPI00197E6803|nr:GntR family transcriptional regulator [Propioniciclava coleopterorum]